MPTATATMSQSDYVILLAGAAWALLGSFLTALADRQDAAHYYEGYERAQLADMLSSASVVGLGITSILSLVFVVQRIPGPAAGTVELVILAVVAALVAVMAMGILRYGHRFLVPGLLTGAGAGMCLLAVLGSFGIHDLGLRDTAALGWALGVGAAIIIMIVAFIITAMTDPMP